MTPADLSDSSDAFADLAKTASEAHEHQAAALYHLGAAIMHAEAELLRRVERLEKKLETVARRPVAQVRPSPLPPVPEGTRPPGWGQP